MTVTLSYDSQLSRVRINADTLGSAVAAVVERSTDQIRWAPVRGGTAVPVTAGTMSTLDDYEFNADVLNYYRVRYVDIVYVGAGTAVHAVNASVVPSAPGGLQVGDVKLIVAAIRNSGAGSPDTPAGWELVRNSSNFRMFARVHQTGDTAPTITFTGGVAGADTTAQMAAVRGVGLTHVEQAGSSNASAQNIATPLLTFTTSMSNGAAVLHLGWKQDDWTSVAPIAGATEIGEPSTTTGDDQGVVWDYRIYVPGVTVSSVAADSFVVTGGVSAVSRGGVVALAGTETAVQSSSITPTLDGVWLKFIARPFLNTLVEPWGDIRWTRRSRNGVFDVVGRSNRVSVSDLRLSREGPLQLKTVTVDDYERLDLVLAGGDPVFIHAPAGHPLPTMYADIGDVQIDSPVPGTYFFTLPLIQVSAPAPEIVGATATYQTVINNYVTYADVLAAFATYGDLLEEIAQPADIEVP